MKQSFEMLGVTYYQTVAAPKNHVLIHPELAAKLLANNSLGAVIDVHAVPDAALERVPPLHNNLPDFLEGLAAEMRAGTWADVHEAMLVTRGEGIVTACPWGEDSRSLLADAAAQRKEVPSQ